MWRHARRRRRATSDSNTVSHDVRGAVGDESDGGSVMSERFSLSREHTRTLVAAAVTAAVVIIVIQQSWAGGPITTDSVLSFVIPGVALGSIYGVAAQGLVVTYSTSGIFNFAQGAIGMFMT